MKFAAGVLPYCTSTQKFLIAKRGPNISNPNQWTNFGGGSEGKENQIQTAIREFREESGYQGPVKLIKSYPTKNNKDGIVFYNYIGIVPKEFRPTTLGKKTVDGNIEVSKCAWITLDELYNLSQGILHPGFYKFLNLAKDQLSSLQGERKTEMNKSLEHLLNKLHENYFQEEESEETCDESNTTGSGEVVNTPFAFSKKVKDPDDVSYSDKVTESFYSKMDNIYNRIQTKITELNYNDYKGDQTKTERQKINSNIIEINRKLREVEVMLNHASKLKLETGSDQTVFWKGTLGNFLKIKERLNRLSTKITEMNS